MKTKLFIIIIFLPLILNAQFLEFAPDGAKWYYRFVYSPGFSDGYYYLYVDGDTIYNNKPCKIIRHIIKWHDITNNSTYTITGFFIVHVTSDKVYYLYNNRFYVLYDFSAMPGDTWQIAGFCHQNCDTVFTVHVDSVSTVIINNIPLKKLYIHTNVTNNCGVLLWGPIIERIGAVGFLKPITYGWTCLSAQQGPLRCYYDSLLGWYNTNISPSCDYVLSVDKNHLEQNNYFEISYNPELFTIYVEYFLSKKTHIEIFLVNTIGQKIDVLENDFKEEGYYKRTYDVKHLKKGVYIINMKTNNIMGTKKIIKF